MKTSLEEERAEGGETATGKNRISFSVDALLGARPRERDHDSDGRPRADSDDDSDVDIEDLDSSGDADAADHDHDHEQGEEESRTGVVVPRPLLPRLYQGPPPPSWPFGAFPWMSHNPIFRPGSPNSESLAK
ncbi:hypothetical protein EVAR_59415_1 [Eumeta japonica]|uniref:Uncharacterized protein n=1 Tax=Eumeta variegata TaxID=151549 RepID=A0A4C1Z2N7_EUMVA|nr:hypothetical protein EVAR_59415_1 [Eumeta japonica]